MQRNAAILVGDGIIKNKYDQWQAINELSGLESGNRSIVSLETQIIHQHYIYSNYNRKKEKFSAFQYFQYNFKQSLLSIGNPHFHTPNQVYQNINNNSQIYKFIHVEKHLQIRGRQNCKYISQTHEKIQLYIIALLDLY
ncbi:Hypothetical_protein [Hexamita inflata]|uniref:Hypothetical_protein n=1 Tax=Hexamita inflata TaxID=28002 RepID=A0AA86TUF2_9EUKA|nr:Hypothetical protein HINF_LOCUS16771 [Hexamita inflata]